jgi:hypothetical protein
VALKTTKTKQILGTNVSTAVVVKCQLIDTVPVQVGVSNELKEGKEATAV